MVFAKNSEWYSFGFFFFFFFFGGGGGGAFSILSTTIVKPRSIEICQLDVPAKADLIRDTITDTMYKLFLNSWRIYQLFLVK